MNGFDRMLGGKPQAMWCHRQGLPTRQPVKSIHPYGLGWEGRLSAPGLDVAPLRPAPVGLILGLPSPTQPSTTMEQGLDDT